MYEMTEEQRKFKEAFNMMSLPEKKKIYLELHDALDPRYRRQLMFMIGASYVYGEKTE